MHVARLVIALGFLAGSAQAQRLDAAAPDAPSPPRLGLEGAGRFGPLAEGFTRYQPLYGGNESANPNDRLFKGFRTDPRLVLGYAFMKNIAIEAGYSHLHDRGFHGIDPDRIEAAVSAGALGAKSHTTHVAAKLTLPLGERVSAYGKFGIAQSLIRNDGLLPPGNAPLTAGGREIEKSERGAYGALGASYRVNERVTVSGEVRKNSSADTLRGVSNASGARGNVGIGF